MKLPVLDIVRATWRDQLGFARRHPLALTVTLLCSGLVDYGVASLLEDPDRHGVAETFVSIMASAVTMAMWLPCLFASVRASVTRKPASLELRSLLPPTAAQYFGLSLSLNLPTLLSQPLISVDPLFRLPVLVLAIVSTFLALRTTLAFTALALGLREPSLSSSYRLTAGLTLRLLAIVTLSLLSIGTLLALIILGLGLLLIDILGSTLTVALLGSTAGFAYLICAVAGAHVYRAMLPSAASSAQNGRYW